MSMLKENIAKCSFYLVVTSLLPDFYGPRVDGGVKGGAGCCEGEHVPKYHKRYRHESAISLSASTKSSIIMSRQVAGDRSVVSSSIYSWRFLDSISASTPPSQA